jgi:hypothetical protein
LTYSKKFPINFVDEGEDVHNTVDKFIKEIDEIYTDINDVDTKKAALTGAAFTGTVTLSGDTIVTLDSGKIPESQLQGYVPIGGIIMFSGTVDSNGNPLISGTADTNWHICDGGSGTLNLSNKFIVASGTTYAIGATGGAATVTLTEAQLPVHHHHGIYIGTSNDDNGDATSLAANAGAADSHQWMDGGITGDAGSGTAHNNLPPYYALAFIQRIV